MSRYRDYETMAYLGKKRSKVKMRHNRLSLDRKVVPPPESVGTVTKSNSSPSLTLSSTVLEDSLEEKERPESRTGTATGT